MKYQARVLPYREKASECLSKVAALMAKKGRNVINLGHRIATEGDARRDLETCGFARIAENRYRHPSYPFVLRVDPDFLSITVHAISYMEIDVPDWYNGAEEMERPASEFAATVADFKALGYCESELLENCAVMIKSLNPTHEAHVVIDALKGSTVITPVIDC